MLIILLLVALAFSSCSTTDRLLGASGVREVVANRQTDLLISELHYPITNNTNLDDLLRERIRSKYLEFRQQLDDNSIEYLNLGRSFSYKATFEVARSADLRLISFVLYASSKVQDKAAATSAGPIDGLVAEALEVPVLPTSAATSDVSKPAADAKIVASKTAIEVIIYSLKYDKIVDFRDVVTEPLLVFAGLAASCLRQLNDYAGPGNFYSQGIKADWQHLSMLALGQSGINVYFPPGQVMSPASGVINILVPWQEAIPNKPWQYGITRNLRPLAYRSRPKESASVAAARP